VARGMGAQSAGHRVKPSSIHERFLRYDPNVCRRCSETVASLGRVLLVIPTGRALDRSDLAFLPRAQKGTNWPVGRQLNTPGASSWQER
jgi:hypothetical protein